MAWTQQGPIAQREKEKLGEGDKGVILFRRLLKEQLRAIQAGKEPMNVFRTPPAGGMIPLPLEKIKRGQTIAPPRYVPGEAGYSADANKIEAAQATWNRGGAVRS
jgi:hypothetical protein